MLREPMAGRKFMKMMAPVLGLDRVSGIVGMRITAQRDDVTVVEVDMVAGESKADISVDPEPANETAIRTRKYTVTVTEVIE